MHVHLAQSSTSIADEFRPLEIEQKIGVGYFGMHIYTDKSIGAQEYPSNGRDATRKLLAMPQVLQEEINLLRALQEGTDLESAVQAHIRYGVDAQRASIPKAHESLLEEYAPCAALTREEREALIKHAEAVLQRVGKTLDRYTPTIVMDMTDPTMVRITDNGCGMTERVIDQIFRHYGRSDKRGHKGADQIGGFGIGAKSGFAVSDAFEVITRSIEDDATYHVLVTGQGIKVSRAERELPHYGTTIQIPLTDPKLREAYRQKYLLKVATWTERCLLLDEEAEEIEGTLVSQRLPPWQAEDVIVRAQGEGWEAAVLPRQRRGLSVDTVYVEGIPFPLDEQTFPGFQLVVKAAPILVRLPITRETIKKDDHRARLLQTAKDALMKTAQAKVALLGEEAKTTSLACDIADVCRRIRGEMVLAAYAAQGGLAQGEYGNLDSPAHDRHIELADDPEDIFTLRAIGVVTSLGGRTTWGKLIRQEYTPTEEGRQAIAYLGKNGTLTNYRVREFAPGRGKHAGDGCRSPLLTIEGAPGQTHEVPAWVRFMATPLPHVRIRLDADGTLDISSRLVESPFAPFFDPDHEGGLRVVAARTKLPDNRTTAFEKLLGAEAETAKPLKDDLASYFGQAGLEEIRVVVGPTRLLSWLAHWEVPDARELPADKKERPARERGSGEPADAKVPVLVAGPTCMNRRLGDFGSSTRFVLVGPEEENQVRYSGLVQPTSPWAYLLSSVSNRSSFHATSPVVFLREPGPARLRDMAALGVKPWSLAKLKERLAEAKVNTLLMQDGEVVRGPRRSLRELLEGGERIVTIPSAESLAEAHEGVEHDLWVRRLPSGVLLLDGETVRTLRTTAGFLGETFPATMGAEATVLETQSKEDSRLLVRMPFRGWDQFHSWLTFANKGEPAEVLMEFWLHDSPHHVLDATHGLAEIVQVEELPKPTAATKASRRASA